MSDLRERLLEAMRLHEDVWYAEIWVDKVILPVVAPDLNAANLEGLSWKARAEQNYAEWEAANKKIERLEEDVRQYRAMAEAAERERWVDANDYAILKQRVYKLLDQTIEVLEGAPGDSGQYALWMIRQVHPLLDNLKALKKEGTENEQPSATSRSPL